MNVTIFKELVEIGDCFQEKKILFLGRRIFKPPFHTFELMLKQVDNELAYCNANKMDLGIEYKFAKKITKDELNIVLDRMKSYLHSF